MDEIAKILIVEDERIIALEMQRKLETMGYDVPAIVSSGKEAVIKSEELRPDLVLMDIVLQGEMDGVEAAGQIHARFGIPVVYITANVSDARLEDITRSEPSGCLFKPFEDMELQAAVKMALYKHKMEQKLRESEETFRILAETTPVAVMVYQGSKWVYANSAACEICGYSKEEISSMNYWDFVHPDYLELIKARGTQRQESTLNIPRYDFKIITKSGEERWVDLSGGTLTKYKGKPAGIISVVDITERKQVEEALRESEERFQTIFESPEEGYYEVDLAGRFTFFNETMRKMSGYSTGELTGMSNLEYSTPEAAKMIYKVFGEIYKTGNPATITEYEGTVKDGTKTTLGLSAYLMRDEKGEPAGFRGIVRNVTKQKEMEEELRKSEARYRLLAENAADVIWTTDLDLRFTYVSPSALTLVGYTPEDHLNMTIDRILSPASRELVYKAFEEEIKLEASGRADPNRTRTLELEQIRKDGSVVQVEMKISGLRDPDGRLTGILGVTRDITDRRQAEEEIKAHQKHLALINQILRHDLTNDLVVIQSALNLYNKSPEEEFLKEISSHTKKSLGLINRMRELETFVSRHRELKMYEMRDIIDEVIKNYPSIDSEIEGKARVMADDSIVSVIDNIIGNAVIHGKADRITITAGRERDMCEVRIADNGTGIPDEIKPKVFEEGFKHGDTGHTGIGLHIVKKAMESYGGYTWVEDNEPKGAVIVLRFRMVK